MLVLDDEFVKAINMSEEEIKLEFAIWLYEKADYSFYVAAKFAGMHWMDFVKELGKREISIFDEKSVLKDIEMASKHAKNNC